MSIRAIKRVLLAASVPVLEAGQSITLLTREKFDTRGPRKFKAVVHGISKQGFYVVITEKPAFVYILKPDGAVIAYAMWTKNPRATAEYALTAEHFWDDRDPTKKFYLSRPGYETWTATK